MAVMALESERSRTHLSEVLPRGPEAPLFDMYLVLVPGRWKSCTHLSSGLFSGDNGPRSA